MYLINQPGWVEIQATSLPRTPSPWYGGGVNECASPELPLPSW